MKVYKGTDKDIKCHGFEFEIGKEYMHDGKVEPCRSGFHACENSLDVLHYYIPALQSRYFEAEADGEIKHHDEDSKIACSKITLTAELSLISLIKIGIKTIFERVKNIKCTPGDQSTAVTSGDQSTAVTSGYRSTAATSGGQSTAVTSGGQSTAVTSGDQSTAVTSGYQSTAATSGYQSTAATSGDRSTAATSGYQSTAATSGKDCIAIANGFESKAKGVIGNYLVLTEYDVYGKLLACKCVKVDGKKIKPDTLYMLVGGEFEEVKDDGQG